MTATETAHFYAADGTALPGPDGAATAEITEYVDGVVRARHYLTREGPPRPARPRWTDPGTVGTEPDVEEFAKDTWDLWADDGDGTLTLVTSLPALLHALGVDDAPTLTQRAAVAALLPLQSWSAAPEGLRVQTYQWLTATRADG